MSVMVRVVLAVALLAVAGFCGFLAVAAREAPRDSWWAYWVIEGAAGLACLLAAAWLLRPRQSRA